MFSDFNVKLDAFDRAVVMARQLGKGAFMSKIDIESAYRCIPVRPVDWPLLGMSWNNQFYFDIVMQFGITSATAIFEWYSSAAQYIVEKSCGISNIVHYIDDFFTLVNGLAAAKHALKNILAVFAELGLPVSLSKLEMIPSVVLTRKGCVSTSESRLADGERLVERERLRLANNKHKHNRHNSYKKAHEDVTNTHSKQNCRMCE